jgi:ribosomal protein S6--L-glutamate ligase
VLEAGDRLLCFGKLELMRDLVPARVRRRRRPKVLELPASPLPDAVSEQTEVASSRPSQE